MQILSITPHTNTYTTGRLSDGSDRQTVTVTEYHIIVQDGGKYEATLQTDDQQAIADAYADGLFTAMPVPEPTPEEIQAQTLLNTEFLVVMAELSNM